MMSFKTIKAVKEMFSEHTSAYLTCPEDDGSIVIKDERMLGSTPRRFTSLEAIACVYDYLHEKLREISYNAD